ncbi:MAG TPA: ActD-like protein [Polyangia bacterium]|jgi:hypothetical protein
MMEPQARTPDWLLERLAADDLPPERAAEVRARLAAEPDGAARLAALAASNRAILARLPAPAMAAAIQARARRRRRFALLALAPAVAAAALVVVVVTRAGPGVDPAGGGIEPTRIKGAPQLVLHREAELKAERLAPGARVRAGEVVQVAYVAAGRRYGAIVSVDGHGKVTRHLPETGEDAPPLAAGGAVALPHAFELDEAPGFERFILVTAPAPFALAPVVAAARAAGAAQPLALPAGLEQTSFLLRKAD